MRDWFRGQTGGLCIFLVIAALVVGGLGWVSAAVLRLESEQQVARADHEWANRLRLALWRLDSRVAPMLAYESKRAYYEYSAVYAPSSLLDLDARLNRDLVVLAPSPLLDEELPPWMRLHFQFDASLAWQSPQVLPQDVVAKLDAAAVGHRNLLATKASDFERLQKLLPTAVLLAKVREVSAEAEQSVGLLDQTIAANAPADVQTSLQTMEVGQQVAQIESPSIIGPDPSQSVAPGSPTVTPATPGATAPSSAPVEPSAAGPDPFGVPTAATPPAQPVAPTQPAGLPPQPAPSPLPAAPQQTVAPQQATPPSQFAPQQAQQLDEDLPRQQGQPAPSQSRYAQPYAQPQMQQGGIGQQAATVPEYSRRVQQKMQIERETQSYNYRYTEGYLGNTLANGLDFFNTSVGTKSAKGKDADPSNPSVTLRVGPMAPVWLSLETTHDTLVLARLLKVGEREICQAIWIDVEGITESLLPEVRDLFPAAQLRAAPLAAVTAYARSASASTGPAVSSLDLERTMSALPLQLDPGPRPALADPGWTALRIGLMSAWVAALVALIGVAVGGWSLIEFSERRVRFVSAVTHELRTPLTTLRLYLDMLTSGMVTDEKRKGEYLETLSGEADRLNRLISNVLDFSRLEKQRPSVEIRTHHAHEVVSEIVEHWSKRCESAEKELVVEWHLAETATIETDVRLVQQIVGNLIDNACKYSRDAADRRVLLRIAAAGPKLILAVEDFGPGIVAADRKRIFEPFCRGRRAHDALGGVGLGLALASRWARLLGGTLSVQAPTLATGASFQLELPRAVTEST